MHRLASLRSLIQWLLASLREAGPRATARLVASRARALVRKREALIVLAKDLGDLTVPARQGGVRLEVIGRGHLPALREFNRERNDLPADKRFADDLDASYGGFVGFKDDELVGCYWWVDNRMRPLHRDLRDLGLEIELAEADVYGYDLYIGARHRAGGTAADFLYQVESGLRERGFNRIWGYVVETNKAARWTYSSRGYRPMWRVLRTRTLLRWTSRTATSEGENEKVST